MLILVKLDNSTSEISVQIPDDDDVLGLAQMIQMETGIPLNQQSLMFNNQNIPISDRKVAALGITEGSLINVTKVIQQKKISLQDIPQNPTAEQLLELVQNHPHLLEQLRGNDPKLVEALQTKNIPNIRMVLMSRYLNHHKQVYQQKKELESIEADPMSEENQRKIEAAIQRQNIESNMELAYENIPETFARVQMLYVSISINNYPIKAFVDSGAQSTIMSKKCAEKCNVMRLLDTRFAGEARGVGTAKILGKIHIAQMKFGNTYYPISITVLENDGVDFLFGLDTLRRYNGIINLAKNVLCISNGIDSYEEVSFLSDSEVTQMEDLFNHKTTGDETTTTTKATSGSSGSSSGSGSTHTEENKMNIDSISATTATTTTTMTDDMKMNISDSHATATTSQSSSSQPSIISSSQPSITSSSTPPTTSTTAATNLLQDKITQLQALGFHETQARAALLQTGGDVELAATLLLENS